MHFGENELSPGSIGFSPLYLPHPPAFQRRWVRTSTVSYHSFILDRYRSPGFASTTIDLTPYSDSVSLRLRFLNLANNRNSQDHSPKGTPSHTYGAPTACKHTVSDSISLPSRGSFHLSLTVLCAIGQQEYLALRDMVHADSHRISRVRWYSGKYKTVYTKFFIQDFHLLRSTFPCRSNILIYLLNTVQFFSYTPHYPIQTTAASLTFIWFRLIPVRSPLLGESFLLSFPRIT